MAPHASTRRASRAKIRNLMRCSLTTRDDTTSQTTIPSPSSAKAQSGALCQKCSCLPKSTYSFTVCEQREDSCSLGCGHGGSHQRTVRSKVVRRQFAGKQVSVLRSIVKQSVGPCKTEASQKPVPLDEVWFEFFVMASLCAIPSTDGLGLRRFSPPGEVPFLGTGLLRPEHRRPRSSWTPPNESAGIPFDIRIQRC